MSYLYSYCYLSLLWIASMTGESKKKKKEFTFPVDSGPAEESSCALVHLHGS